MAWFRSYLAPRQQIVVVGDEKAESQLLQYGVPQGSALGPKLYPMYTMPIGRILKANGLDHHSYVDDTQAYNTFVPCPTSDKSEGIEAVERGLDLARSWFEMNMFKLNNEKTEVIAITLKTRASVRLSITLGDCVIESKPCIRDLGVNIDNTLSMEPQVNQVCRCASYHLRNIGSVRRYLSTDATKSLVQGLVTSSLDYCNALLVGLPMCLTVRLQLQRVQSSAARVISRTSKRQHISPVLISLYWLPVSARIEYNVLPYVYKALLGIAPGCLDELIQPKVPSRFPRSNSTVQVIEPRTRTKAYGERSLRYAAARLWDGLPQHMRPVTTLNSFKKSLKTYLFKVHCD